MLLEISERRRVKPPSEIYRPGDLLPYTLRGISRKFALLLGQCGGRADVQWVSQQPDLVSLMFMFAYHIRLKMCVGYTELGNRVRPTAGGLPWGYSHRTWGRKKNCLVASVDWIMGPG